MQIRKDGCGVRGRTEVFVRQHLEVTSDANYLFGMLNLSAAFDCVDLGFLLDRLETSFGFSGVVLDWMRLYLV